MIEFQLVRRSYGRKLAVDDLNMVVRPGEIFALLGPNGAGKTTSIKMLVGLLRPDRGTIRVGGIDVVADPRNVANQIGFVPDELYLYDKLSGREFLEFCGQLRGLSDVQIAEAIRRETERFELRSFLDELSETYSHGMRQRLAFAAALLHRPAALVLDEPMVGLDPRSMRMVKDLLRQQAAEGAIVLMSTHTLAMAEEMADRIAIMNRGRLRFLGSVSELQQMLSAERSSLEDLFLRLTNGEAHGEPAARQQAP